MGWAIALIGLLAPFSISAQSPSDAEAMEAAGDWHGAESIWRLLAAKNPKDYRPWTSLGVALAHQNKFSEAIEAYVKALALNPQTAQTNLNLGLAYFKSGQLEKAIAPLKKAETALPASGQIETVLGMCLYGTGRYGEAARYLELAETKNPDNKELRFVIAQAYLWSGQYQKAKLAFQTMLEQDPDSPQVQILLGEAYDGLGRTEEAIKAFRKAASQGQIPDAHFGLGYLLWKTHSYEQAATEFRNELRIDSKNYKALAYLGDCELELQDLEAARRHLLESVALQDVLWIAHFDLGKMETNEKHYESARKQFQRAIELEPNRPEAHYRMAQVYQALGETSEAHKELQIVTRLHEVKNEDLILKVSGNKAAVQ